MNMLIQFVRELVQELQGKLGQFIQRINENKLTTAGILLTFSFTSLAAIILNDGFENGTTGWSTVGSVTTPYNDIYQNFYHPDYESWRVTAYQSGMAKLDAEVAVTTVAGLNSFFGLSGSITSVVPNAFNGVAIESDSFTATAGEHITASVLFGQRDLGDNGCAILINNSGGIAASTLLSGAAVGTGWTTVDLVAPSAGSYTLGFCSVNNDDEYIGSTLYVDNAHGTETIPEPATIALFGIGLAGLTWYRRKKAWA